ncbi:hypothetical protein [Microbacterium sp. T2.11-28]|uniref:hypothetical protein n=1 Tax=Microbacterium sp. T2.11-28 TaxID=3041169 RepID=UPI0024776FB2|nr:hypothetical protein [Microbacterium sp. T2.11-28]CAI9393474.1 hypothetical protein MICABA_02459 [Microbacterium sp. T2.11-28]
MRRILTAALIAGALCAVAGCSAAPLVGEGVACASWVAYETDEQRAAAADLVIVATGIERDGTMSILGYDANAYTVRVAEVEKGTVDGGAGTSLRVGSTADSCSGRPYGDGDQMLQAEPLRLFLTRAESGWTTLTPFDGARPVDDGATSRPSPGPSTPAPDD